MVKAIRRGNCPSCGASVDFRTADARVVVCGSCSSIVARSDRALESIGQVAALVDTASALHLGLRGSYEGKSFELVGHAQYRHALGGVWDEWYAAFSNGHWGWLAEAQGRFTFTFEAPARDQLPPFSALRVGATVPGWPAWTVAEAGAALLVSAAGELPRLAPPGASLVYADLTSTGGGFGTIDYSSEPPSWYVGRELRLGELGFRADDLAAAPAREVGAAALACPHCGGAVELRAPDQSERVVCAYCSSLLDSREGVLRYLQQLQPPPHPPLIPLGQPVDWEGAQMLTLAHLVRKCTIEGEDYTWEEYLLYHPAVGFRWLVYSDFDWMFGHGIAPAEVDELRDGAASYAGHRYEHDQSYTAEVIAVAGEVYWPVAIGERVEVADYTQGPRRLSREEQRYAAGGEVSWTALEVRPLGEVRRRTGVKVPGRSGVGMSSIFWILICVLLLLMLVYIASSDGCSGGGGGGGFFIHTGGSGSFGGGK